MNNEAILVADLRSTARRVCDMIDVRHGSQLMLQAADVIEQREAEPDSLLKDAEKRGYTAAIADVKAGGAQAWSIFIGEEPTQSDIMKANITLEFARRQKLYPDPSRKIVPLYKLPEDV